MDFWGLGVPPLCVLHFIASLAKCEALTFSPIDIARSSFSTNLQAVTVGSLSCIALDSKDPIELIMAEFIDRASPYLKMHDDSNTAYFNMLSGTVMLLMTVTLVYVLWKTTPKKQKALDPENWVEMPLRKIEEVSHDVKKFRFFFETPMHILGLPIGQHISLKFIDPEGKEVQRSYTPITSDVDSGYVEFMIKVYFKGVHPNFPEGAIINRNNRPIGRQNDN